MTVANFSTLPNRQHLLALGAGVAALHLVLLVSSGSNIWRLQPESQKLGPLQTRVLNTETAQPKLDSAVQAPPVARPVPRAPAREAMPHSQQTQDAGMQAVASAALPTPPDDPAALPTRIATPNDITEPVPPSNTSSVPPIVNPAEPAIKQATPNASALVAKVGNFPDNTQINYKLTGQERGLNYHASGSLKWQAKAGTALPKAYEAELRVKAFLVGSRVWRSVGQLAENGLAPTRYSDSWRGERAAHFEADTQKISFSGNLPSAPLLPGAQDQVSLFIQMAATVSAQSFAPGAELNVQTATARDAVNWTLTYKADEFIDVNGDRLETQRWVCLPRGKFDSQIEMWLAKAKGGLPARIKITQVSGNFIDMEMRSSEALAALPD
jgi:hypothetical protein